MISLRIGIIGAGHVGLVSGCCLAKLGHDIMLYDCHSEVVRMIADGHPWFYERDLDTLLAEGLSSNRITPTENITDLASSSIWMFCVPTPQNPDGGFDLTFLNSALAEAMTVMRDRSIQPLLVLRCTTSPGNARECISQTARATGFRAPSFCCHPEFLREGSAIEDFLRPDRLVVGVDRSEDAIAVLSLYDGIRTNAVIVSPEEAEFVKIGANVFLASRISLANELADCCKIMCLDSISILDAIGLDKRIGRDYLQPGLGFGGSCLDKDLSAMIHLIESRGGEAPICRCAKTINDSRPKKVIEALESILSLSNARIGILGLSFKSGTDDIRGSRSLKVAELLLNRGAIINVHDPMALDSFMKVCPNAIPFQDVSECIRSSDAIVIATSWPQYANPELYGNVPVVDCRNVTRSKKYQGLSW